MFELDDYRCPSKTCPGVVEGGFKRKAILEYVSLYDFWRCPECGIEIWEPMDRGDNKVSGREARAAYRAEQRYKDAIRLKKGGSKKAGRKREKPKKYYRPWVP